MVGRATLFGHNGEMLFSSHNLSMDISVLKGFADSLQAKFSLPGTSSPEDQLKIPIAELLKDTGAPLGLNVESRTEAHLAEHKVRPDIAIYVGKLICGYIELKAPGLGANAPKLKGEHNKAQWSRLKSLPNLVYTDGREWALYRSGELQGTIISLDDDPTERGRKAVSKINASDLGALLWDFLTWKPIVPAKPKSLAQYLAPLTRLLRLEVEAALADPASAATLLATEWRQYFFPEADDGQFADAYAQTVAYAMLLARIYGAKNLNPTEAAIRLGKNNGVLAIALERLGQEEARKELRVGFELLQRSLEALDPYELLKAGPEMWLYFYEDFLAAYDPKLRNDYGVYYTPRAVVELQIRLVSELLETRFDKSVGFADDGVIFIDPAVGTGTYLVAAVKNGLAKVRDRYGKGAVPACATQMARNMHGFEVLIGPYAVAHLRLTQAIESEGAALEGRLNIYLADTLDSPNIAPPGGLTLTYKVLTKEHEAARKVKSEGEILVCLGNPPYDRQQIEESDTTVQRKGGWVRFGDQIKGGAPQERQGERAILKDFTEPAEKAGAGVHIKNLYNDYVYFWRWALWRLFEQQQCGGIISFITASSYLAGPGFIGMREAMRRTFDDLWIIDLGGDNRGTRKTANVFNIQTPVAIAIGMRGANTQANIAANVRYAKIEGESREAKLGVLDGLESYSTLKWRDCPSDWHAPFLPLGTGAFFEWPLLIDLFPWQHSGAQFKRTWPIGETEEVLRRRLARLTGSPVDARKQLFKETRDRKINGNYRSFSGNLLLSVSKISGQSRLPQPKRYCYRQFDRQYALIDNRFGDYLRPPLVLIAGPSNVYLLSPTAKVLGEGAAIGVSVDIPDLDVFRGSFGGKDVIPLYRDVASKHPNVTDGLLDVIGSQYGETPTPEDLAAYVYVMLGGQSYTRRFWNELQTPGPRVPITKDATTFTKAVALGRHLIWLHTYAECFGGDGRGNKVPVGSARYITPVADGPENYPETFTWIETEQAIRVGEGRFGPIPHKVWDFQVSGLKVVQSWLGYRMKRRAGKQSSPLDNIRPKSWTPRMSKEFLELLWVLEATLELEPELEQILDRAVSGPCFKATELPKPMPEKRQAPKVVNTPDHHLRIFDTEDDDTE